MTHLASSRSASSRRLVRLAFAMAAVVTTGCGPDSDPAPLGTLEISWTFGPNSCAEGGVERITIELDDAIIREASCDEGEVTIEDLEPGNRQLALTGLDLDGVERFAAVPKTVAIVADGVATADDVLLSALPARVDVTWYFTNGRLCSTNAVDRVEMSVWRDGFLEGSTDAACDEGTAAIAGLSSGTFVVELRALDDKDDLVTTAETEVELDKGDRAEVEIPLAVDAG